MKPDADSCRLDSRFLYERYQAVVEHFESGDLKITFGILALVAGVLVKDLAKDSSASLAVLIYRPENLAFIIPLFLWGAMYSSWNRYRVLHAVKRLVRLERAMRVSKSGYSYWMGNTIRPWIYLLISPWPWILLLFAVGGFRIQSGLLGQILLSSWFLAMLGLAIVFEAPCRAVCAFNADRVLSSEEHALDSLGGSAAGEGS